MFRHKMALQEENLSDRIYHSITFLRQHPSYVLTPQDIEIMWGWAQQACVLDHSRGINSRIIGAQAKTILRLTEEKRRLTAELAEARWYARILLAVVVQGQRTWHYLKDPVSREIWKRVPQALRVWIRDQQLKRYG